MHTEKIPVAKYKVGDKVTHKVNLWGYNTGTVKEVEKTFAEMQGELFKPKGLCTLESTIKMIRLPYTFDGYTLTVVYPQRDYGGGNVVPGWTMVSKFNGYVYTVEDLAGHYSVYDEKQLKRIE